MDIAELGYSVDSSDLDKAVKALDRLDAAAKKGGSGIEGMADKADKAGRKTERAFGGLSAVAVKTLKTMIAFGGITLGLGLVKELGQAADAYRGINSRLELVTKTQERFNAAQSQTYLIAQKTRAPLDATAALYGKMQAASDGLGRSQSEALRATELINKTFKISGASAQTASGAIFQLAQGLGAGALRGDELNSVMEGAPRFAQALADSLGITTGELRAMGAEGKITTDIIMDAFASQGAAIDAEYSKIKMTNADAWQMVKNAAVRSIGQMAEGIGAIDFTAGILARLASFIEKVPRIVDQWVGFFRDAFEQLKVMGDEAWTAFGVDANAALDGVGENASSVFSRIVTELMILPTSLRTVVVIGIGELDKLLASASEKFGLMRIAGQKAWLSLEEATGALSGKVQGFFMTMARQALGQFVKLTDGAARMAEAVGASDVAAKLRVLGQELNNLIPSEQQMAAATKATADALAARRATLDKDAAALKAETQRRRDFANGEIDAALAVRDAAIAQVNAAEKVIAADESVSKGKGKKKQLTDEEIKAIEKLNKAQLDAVKAIIQAEGAVSELAKAEADYKLAVIDATEAYNANLRVGLKAADAQEVLAAQLGVAKKAFDEATKAAEKNKNAYADAVKQINDGYDTAIRLAGMSAKERRLEEAAINAVAYAEAQLAAMSPDMRKAEEARLAALGKTREAQLVVAEEARQAADDAAIYWQGFSDDLAGAMLDGTESVKDYFKSMLKDMVKQLLSSGIFSMIKQLFGAATNGGASGGWLSQVFSAMGQSGGQGGGTVSSLMSASTWVNFGKKLWSGLSGGATGAGGVSTWFSSLFSGAAGASATGAAGGAAGASGAAAGSSGGIGAAGAAAGAAAWFAAAIAANFMAYGNGWRKDSSELVLPNGESVYGGGQRGAGSSLGATLGAGGIIITNLAESILSKIGFNDKWANIISGASLLTKLFGRKAPVLTSAEQTYGVGAGGATGSETYGIYEKGGWFSSSKRYNKTFEGSEETMQAARELFDSIEQIMLIAARELGAAVPRVLEGSLRVFTEFEKDGKTVKATKYFVDVLGRQWEEATKEAALKRLQSEALISAIDQAMSNGVADATPSDLPATQAAAESWVRLIDRTYSRAMDSLDPIDGPPGRGGAPGSSGQGEASRIAERWRDDADLLAEGAQMMLAAASDIRKGAGLLADGSLTDVVDLVEELQQAGETLGATYERLVQGTLLLEQAFAMSGVQLDLTREAFVRFSAEIVDAAGGLDSATALFNSFYSNFYTELERSQYIFDTLTTSASGAFEAIGLSLDTFTGSDGMAMFRAMFESVMPTLSADAMVQWLRAADALAQLNTSSQALAEATEAANAQEEERARIIARINEAIGSIDMSSFDAQIAQVRKDVDAFLQSLIATGMSLEEATEVANQYGEAMIGVIEQQREAAEAAAMLALSDWSSELRESTGELSAYGKAMYDASRWYDDAVAEANRLAKAAGLVTARVEDLASIELRHAQLAAEALKQLQDSANSLIAQLYGPLEGSLGDIEARIAAIEASSQSSFNAVDDGIQQAIDAWLDGLRRVDNFLNSMLLDDSITTLTPEQQLAEAQSQFAALLAAAQGGDADALAQLPGMAQTVLELARSFWSSSDEYSAIFDNIRAALQDLPSVSEAAGGPQTVYVAASGELQALYAERDRLLAEQEAANRLAMAQQLAGYLVEWAAAQEQPILELATSLGVRLDQFVTDLGVDLSHVSVATVQQLADLSGLLGVSLSDLAAGVGVSIGALTDQYSLAAGALAAEILGLPAEQAAALQPYLDAIAAATTAADASAATQTMADYISTLDAAIRDQLAPYFGGLMTKTESAADAALSIALSQHDTMVAQLEAAAVANALLARIADNAMAANNAAGVPSYAVGTYNVPQTGPAILHAGEMVLPVPMAQAWRDGNVGGGGIDPQLVRELINEVRQLRAERIEGDNHVADAARGAGDKVADKLDRQTDADDRRSRELIAALPRDGR